MQAPKPNLFAQGTYGHVFTKTCLGRICWRLAVFVCKTSILRPFVCSQAIKDTRVYLVNIFHLILNFL